MKLPIILMSLFLLLFSGCEKDKPTGPGDPKPIDLPLKSQQVISGSNDFGINLFRETALTEEGNLMLSPLSASTALSMLLNGCEAETRNQIRNMLGYQELTIEEINKVYQSLIGQLLDIDPETRLSLANSVWYRQGFNVKSPFLERLENDYDARTAALDFADPSAVTAINNWAKDNTNGKIIKVLDEISPDAVMFLMNALYFNGTWTYRFDQSLGGPVAFHTSAGNQVNVPMMSGDFPYRLFTTSRCTAVELNYGQQNFAMDIIVPSISMDEFLQDFTGEEWASLVTGIDAIELPQKAVLVMPKFKFEYEKLLNGQLQALGMNDAFIPELADLSGISDADIYVSFVKQNTFVDVNEEGTEAAAVTTIGIVETSMPLPFVVDKPFIFAIRERMSNTLLFIGKVEMPAY